MPIKIEIRTTEGKDYLIIDGFLVEWKDSIKNSDIIENLQFLNYITIKVTEE